MTIKIIGYSVGDWSVGIGSREFEFDTGLDELDENDRENLRKGIIREIWEFHDNGDLRYDFSDEWDKLDDEYKWDFRYRFTWKDSQNILEEERKER